MMYLNVADICPVRLMADSRIKCDCSKCASFIPQCCHEHVGLRRDESSDSFLSCDSHQTAEITTCDRIRHAIRLVFTRKRFQMALLSLVLLFLVLFIVFIAKRQGEVSTTTIGGCNLTTTEGGSSVATLPTSTTDILDPIMESNSILTEGGSPVTTLPFSPNDILDPVYITNNVIYPLTRNSGAVVVSTTTYIPVSSTTNDCF